MLLAQRLLATARAHPGKVALRSGEETLTYGELETRIAHAAGELAERGLGPGERLAILSATSAEAIVAFWAALALGAVPVVLNRRLETGELEGVLDDCEPVVIAADTDGLERVSGYAATRVALDALAPGRAAPGALELPELPELSPDAPAAIVYTSGSSGRPKGVCLSHRNLAMIAETNIAQIGLGPEDSYLLLVPLHYVHGILQLLSHHLAGAAIHLGGEFLFPRQVVEQLRSEKVTGFSGVPLHFVQLIDRGGFLDAELPHLRWLTSTGGRCPPERLVQMLDARPGVRIYIAYGQTECAPRATLLDPSRLRRKIESVGSPIPGVEVRAVSEEGRALPPGEVGEVVVRGENIMLGYWRDPEGTRRVVDPEGWLHTGDLGYFDEEGDLFLVGRRTSMIKTGGERVFAEHVEKALGRHRGVDDVVVLGVPDEVLGERIEAHVVPADLAPDAASEGDYRRELQRHALANLPYAHAPKAYHLWREFPRKDHGKVDREAIRAGLGGQRWGEKNDGLSTGNG